MRQREQIPRTTRGTPDFFLLILTILLVGFGLVMVFSASYNVGLNVYNDALYFTKKQAVFLMAGLLGMLYFMNASFSKLKGLFIPYFIVCLIMLVLVLIVGTEVKGAKSWFRIGSFGGQPTEFAKLGLILYLASLITKKGEKFRDFHKGLLPVMIVVGFVAGLVMMQPDFGSTSILLATAFIVIVVGGANLKHLFVFCATVGLVMSVLVGGYMLATDEYGYRVHRITAYLNPWNDELGTGYHLIQSLYAFGHGGIMGAGFGQSIQKLSYLPEAHNDFIFAIIGEELGYIKTFLFLVLYVLFLWRALIVSLRCPDVTGTIVGSGIVGMIAIQAFINIGGVIGAIPITGVTLPFISFGGSSLLVCLACAGILLSISRESSKAQP